MPGKDCTTEFSPSPLCLIFIVAWFFGFFVETGTRRLAEASLKLAVFLTASQVL
jgi:hypothetical protein